MPPSTLFSRIKRRLISPQWLWVPLACLVAFSTAAVAIDGRGMCQAGCETYGSGLEPGALTRVHWLLSLPFARSGLAAIVNGFVADPRSEGTVRYVAGRGQCGTRIPCYSSIQAAIDEAGPRDVVRILPGEYREKLGIRDKNPTSTAESDRLTIEADPEAPVGSVVLRGRDQKCEGGYSIEFQRSRFVTLRGITIIGAGARGIGLLGGSRDNTAIHLERNRILRGGPRECNGGIDVGRGNPDTVIANNLIYGNGRNGIRFRDGFGGRYLVLENTIVGNAFSGVQLTRGAAADLVNNIIAFNGTASGRSGGRFGVRRLRAGNQKPEDVRLLGNLICGQPFGEVNGRLLDATDSANQTPTGSEGKGVTASPSCGDIKQVFAELSLVSDLGSPAASFVLALGSPAVDGGLDVPTELGPFVPPTSVYAADYNGPDSRPQDGNHDGVAAFDIGAMETSGLTPSPTPVRATPTPTPTATAPATPSATPVATTPTPTASPSPIPTSSEHAPEIRSEPVTSAGTRYLYRYPVDAFDSDAGDILTFALMQAPTGMVIDATSGVIEWSPGEEALGDHQITVKVEDRTGLRDEQSFAVRVEEGVNRPPVIISKPPEAAGCGPGSVIVGVSVASSAVLRSVAPALAYGAPASANPHARASSTDAATAAATPGIDRINWAGASRGTSISPSSAQFLIDELGSGNEIYTTTSISQSQALTLDLGTVREVDEIHLRLYEDDRFLRYRVEGSTDGATYQQLVDRTTGENRGLQRLVLPISVPVRYLRIIGTHSNVSDGFHLIDEVRVIGSAAATTHVPEIVTLDGITDGGTGPTVGNAIDLPAGSYRVSYLDGAISYWPLDDFNGGRTWTVDVSISVPGASKEYRLGFVHNALSLFPTLTQAQQAHAGQFVDIVLPTHTTVYLRVPDVDPGNNRGIERVRITRRAGSSSDLLTRVSDAMTRSVLWEQREVAEWQGWISNANFSCFGCHIQTQASVGLARSRAKVPDLPVSERLEAKFADAYSSLNWLTLQGNAAPESGFPVTQTSLFAWALANQEGILRDRLGPELLRAVDYLLTREDPGGGWRPDDADGNAEKLFADNGGGVSATHTAGNMQALAIAAGIVAGRHLVPFADAVVQGAAVSLTALQRAYVDVVFDQIQGVTGIRLSVRGSFNSNSGNFVINEFEAFDGVEAKPFQGAAANHSQNNFPISGTINGIRTDLNDGWAYAPMDVRTTPAQGLWTFEAPQNLSRVRLTQIYPGNQTKELVLEYTTDPVPTLNSVFVPVPVDSAGVYGFGPATKYIEALRRGVALLTGENWNFRRNVRTAAQTIIGLSAAVPFLDDVERAAAETRIRDADTALRAAQLPEGGWSGELTPTGVPRPFHSAQALEAISIAAGKRLDDAILAGAEYLLNTQGVDGSWVSYPLERRLAATTWVEIALPTIFEVASPPASYHYDIEAIDPDGDTLSFALSSGPAGMEVDPTTGLLTWEPRVGRQSVTVIAQDGRGGAGEQRFDVLVTRDFDCDGYTPEEGDCDDADSTAFPEAIETPGNSVDEDCDGMDERGPRDTDDDGDGYSERGGDCDDTDPGFHPGATDLPGNGIDENCTGSDATPRPSAIEVRPGTVSVVEGERQQFVAIATLPGGALIDITDEVMWLVDSSAVASITATGSALGIAGGATSVSAQKDGVTGSSSLTVVARVADDTPPTVEIATPSIDSAISAPTPIIGTADDANFLRYELEVGPENGDTFTAIAGGASPVVNGPLGTFDPTMLPNGVYRVRLRAFDRGGNSSLAQSRYSVVGDLKLGNFRTTFTDLTIPLAGIPITITRTYDSLDTSPGDFGPGWRLGYPGSVVDSASETPIEGFTDKTRVYVTKPDGKRVGFTFLASCWAFGCQEGFRPDAGVTDTLTTPHSLFFRSAGQYLSFTGPYNPRTFTLTTKEKVEYTLDEQDGLTRIVDPHGNTLDFSATGIASSLGIGVSLERDTQGRITRITEPNPGTGAEAGVLQYVYGAAGNLDRFIDQMHQPTNYSYDTRFPHYLSAIVDPLGRSTVRTVYDDNGRLNAICDAAGDPVSLLGCTQLRPDAISRQQTIFSPRPERFRTDLFLDPRGNVLKERRYLDPEPGATRFLDTDRVYDSSDNLLAETDPDGNVVSYTYDARGNETSRTQGGRTRSRTYNPCNKVLTETDEAGRVTRYEFAPSDCNVASRIDPMSRIARYDYNDAGQMTEFIDSGGSRWQWTYDELSRLASIVDPVGASTSYEYSRAGDLVGMTDRKRQRLTFTYDAAHHRLSETWGTTPSSVVTYSYNSSGQLTGAVDPESSIAIGYDASGRIATVDNAGTPGAHRVTLDYHYDATSNVTEVADSLGGATHYNYDAFNRVTDVRQTGTAIETKRATITYDAAGLMSKVQRFGDLAALRPVATTTYAYDCGGCGQRVTLLRHQRSSDGSDIEVLSFVRDAVGNVTRSVDSDGEHTYSYDSVRQIVTAAHPPGQQPIEHYAYDDAGNRLSSHLSQTYTYAADGHRLIQDDVASYQYDDNGNMISRTILASGEETTFAYDYRNRVRDVATRTRDGVLVAHAAYRYDVANRRIMTTSSGQSIQTVYDGLNPTVEISEPSGTVALRRLYARGLDSILADEQFGATRWVLTDNVGTVRDIVGGNGERVAHWVYDSFGRTMSVTGDAQASSVGLMSRPTDRAGATIDFRARHYAPDLGRFTQEDPFEPFGYVFADNRPLTLRDPTGEQVLLEFAIDVARIVIVRSAWPLVVYGAVCYSFEDFNETLKTLCVPIDKVGDYVPTNAGGAVKITTAYVPRPFGELTNALSGAHP